MTKQFGITRRRFAAGIGAAGLAAPALVADHASAQSAFPTKPITMHNSFPLDGSSALVGRLLAPRMEERLGQKIVLEGHPGGIGGSIAAELVAKAEPDGHVLLMGTIGNITILPSIYKAYAIDPLKAFIPLTRVTFTPNVLIAHPSTPFNTFEEFVRHAKANPGTVSYSRIAPGSIHRMEFESIMAATGVELRLNEKVTGSENAMKALAEGAIQVTITTTPYILPLVRSGRAKALAIASHEPLALLPGVPLFTSLGVADIPSGSWNGLFVPAGTPEPVADKLFDAIRYAAADTAARKDIEALGMSVAISESRSGFRAFLQAETARFSAIAKKASVSIP